MKPISVLDIIVYAMLNAFFIIEQYGVGPFLFLLVGLVYFFLLNLPFNIFWNRAIRSYEDRTGFDRKSTLFEYTIVQFAKWSNRYLNTSHVGSVFYSKNVSRLFFKYRRFRCGAALMSDITTEETTEGPLKGVWFRSPQRGHEHDIVLYYIHGGGLTCTSVYFYAEFLITLVVSLQMQGFKNPAIFALDYEHVPNAEFPEQLSETVAGWMYLVTQFPNSHLVLAGDSNGAALAMSLLLHMANPARSLPLTTPVPPSAAILISPWAFSKYDRHDNKVDFMNVKALDHYARLYTPNPKDHTEVYQSPGLCKSKAWWAKAFPVTGMYIMYGEDEIMAQEIEDMSLVLSQVGRVRVEGEVGKLHAWPIVQMFIGRTIEDREAGVESISSNLSYMLLWKASLAPKTQWE